MIRITLILTLCFLAFCTDKNVESQNITNFSANSDSTKMQIRIKNNSKMTDNTWMEGVWVNGECIEKMKKNHSITKAMKGIDFFISMSFNNTNQFEALTYGEMEAGGGEIKDDQLFILEEIYTFEKVSDEKMLIKGANKSISFLKLKNKKYKRSWDGQDYLFSYLLFGKYKFIDSYNNKVYEISFKENNLVSNYLDYTNYYPSSYVDQDIILFRKDNLQQAFIFNKSDSGFVFTEVENFDWDDTPLIPTGKQYTLKKSE
jgi:hypothetical protein